MAGRRKQGVCPVCAGTRLVEGINDFASAYPLLAQEWSERNEKKPTQTWAKSRENVWWRCGKCDYEWKAVVDSRVKGQKCPKCADNAAKQRKADFAYMQKEGRIEAVRYYAGRAGVVLLENDEETIGIPLQIYMPEQKLAIEFTELPDEKGKHRRWEKSLGIRLEDNCQWSAVRTE